MTVSEQTVRQTFIGNGTADPLAIIIPFIFNSDLIVTSELSGASTALVEGVDYTLVGGSGSGGTITPLAVIPADGTKWVVVRRIPLTQPIDLTNQGSLLPAVIEEGLDRLTLQHLDRDDSILRAVQADANEIDPTGLTMPDLATRISQLCGWDSLGEITAISPDDVLPSDTSLTAFGTAWVAFATALLARDNLRLFYGLNGSKSGTPTVGDLYFSTDSLEVYICKVTNTWLLMSSSQETVRKPNLVVNGSAQINQRVNCNDPTDDFPNDDWNFCLDHVLLACDADGSATVVQNSTTDVPPDGASHCFEVNSAASNKKIGIAFPLSASQVASVLSAGDDRSVSVRFKHKANRIMNLRCNIISWQGTVDAMTDPIADAAWGAEGTLPTLTGAWTYEHPSAGTADEFATATTWGTLEQVDIEINTPATTNLVLLIWADDTDLVASTDKFYISEVHINEGAALAPYVRPKFSEEWAECIRYFQKSFPYATAPGQNQGDTGCIALSSNYPTGQDNAYGANVRYPIAMHASPSLIYYSPSAASNNWYITDGGGGSTGEAVTLYASDMGHFLQLDSRSGFGAGETIGIHYTAVAEITA